MYEIASVLDSIVKSRRKHLHKFLSDIQRKQTDTKAMSLTNLLSCKKSGRIVLLLSAPKGTRRGRDFVVVTDELGEDGVEDFHATKIDETEVFVFLGIDSTLSTYDAKTAYVVPREKQGRPRRTLTPSDEREIRSLHAEGMGINAIALKYHVGNRRIIELLK